jgi:hypothetical protein
MRDTHSDYEYKTTLSFVACSSLSHFVLLLLAAGWPGVALHNRQLISIYTQNLIMSSKKTDFRVFFFKGIRQKDGGYQVSPDSELKMAYKLL